METSATDHSGFHTLVESSIDGIVIVDDDGIVCYLNPAAELLFGVSAGSMLGEVFGFPCATGMAEIRVVRSVDEQPDLIHAEMRTVRVQWGGRLAWLTTLRDISDRKRLMDELARSNEELEAKNESLERAEVRFRATVESAPMAMIMFDAVGVITLVNAETERLFRYEPGRLVGRPLDMLLPERFHDEIPALRIAFVARAEPHRMGVRRELYALRSDGTEFPVEIGLNPVTTRDEVFVLAALLDVTERHRQREERARYTATLEALNADLARSNADLDEFATVVSHDLGTPIRNLRSLASWILDDATGLDATSRGHLDSMHERLESMGALLSELLHYSRIGRDDDRRVEIDLNDLVENVIGLVGPPEGFRITWSGSLPTIVAPRSAVERVFLNLLSNALKHHDRPTGAIHVESSDEGSMWGFRITDDGPGIPPEHHDSVFGLFQTLGSSPGSTGFGLASVRKSVHSLGGEISIESDGTRGTTFRFTIPKHADGAADRLATDARVPPVATDRGNHATAGE